MTTLDASNPGLSRAAQAEDLRFEHAAAAQRSERANRPRHLVILAILVLGVGAVALVVSGFSYRRARAALDQERATADQAVQAAARLKALKQAGAGGDGPRPNEPVDRLLSRIEQAGRDAGLKNPVPLPGRTRGQAQQGMVQVRLDYELRDLSLPALLSWMEGARQEVPGLEVYSLTLRPEAQVWVLRVRFTRWERAEGST